MEGSNPYPDEITQPGQYGRLRVFEPLLPGNPTPEELTWPIVSLTTGKVVRPAPAAQQPAPPEGGAPTPEQEPTT